MVDSILYDAFSQRDVARIYTSLNEYYVILEADPSCQLGPNALRRIYVDAYAGRHAVGCDRHREKNGIMLTDFALAEEREHGLSSEDAITGHV